MARLIDADALYKALKERQDACLKWFDSAKEDDIKDIARGSINAFIEIKLIIEKLPTIDAEPVKRGKWIKMSDADGYYYACSECGNELTRIESFDPQFDLFPRLKSIDKTNYCPNCGAKMDFEEVEKCTSHQ